MMRTTVSQRHGARSWLRISTPASDLDNAASPLSTKKVWSRSDFEKWCRAASASPSSDHAPTKRRARFRSCARIKATIPLHRTQLVSKTTIGSRITTASPIHPPRHSRKCLNMTPPADLQRHCTGAKSTVHGNEGAQLRGRWGLDLRECLLT